MSGYDDTLRDLQIELGKLQQHVRATGRRVAVIFEGRDAAGKGGAIRRFTENLSPREHRVVALAKPTELEQGQWYFQRYIAELPNRGEIVFFDRSWYNRAVVEPVMGFCTPKQHRQFLHSVDDFERLITDDGIDVIKLWFSISKTEQRKRFKDRQSDPLRRWKVSPVDREAQARWADFTRHATQMLTTTSFSYAPWTVVRTDDKRSARLESIRVVLRRVEYPGRPRLSSKLLTVDPNIIIPINGVVDASIV